MKIDFKLTLEAYSVVGLIEALSDIAKDLKSGMKEDVISIKREAPYIGSWEVRS